MSFLCSGRCSTPEVVVLPSGYEVGILVDRRTGEVTTWEDGTVGLTCENAQDAQAEVDNGEAYCPECGQYCEWQE